MSSSSTTAHAHAAHAYYVHTMPTTSVSDAGFTSERTNTYIHSISIYPIRCLDEPTACTQTLVPSHWAQVFNYSNSAAARTYMWCIYTRAGSAIRCDSHMRSLQTGDVALLSRGITGTWAAMQSAAEVMMGRGRHLLEARRWSSFCRRSMNASRRACDSRSRGRAATKASTAAACAASRAAMSSATFWLYRWVWMALLPRQAQVGFD